MQKDLKATIGALHEQGAQAIAAPFDVADIAAGVQAAAAVRSDSAPWKFMRLTNRTCIPPMP